MFFMASSFQSARGTPMMWNACRLRKCENASGILVKRALEIVRRCNVYLDPSKAVSSIVVSGLSIKETSVRLEGRLPARIVVI